MREIYQTVERKEVFVDGTKPPEVVKYDVYMANKMNIDMNNGESCGIFSN